MVATVTSVSTPPILMGELNFKICQHFVGTNLNGGGGRCKIIWGSNIYYYTFVISFHFFRKIQHPEKWSVSFKNFFRKFEYIRSCYLLIASNLRKKSFRKTLFLVLNLTGVMEKKCFVSCIFETVVVIIVIKILEKYLWGSSVLERNF